MISTAATALEPLALAQHAPQSAPHPAVHSHKGGAVAVFVVFKPAGQLRVDQLDDLFQTASIRAFGKGFQFGPQFPQTLVARGHLAIRGRPVLWA